MSGVTHLEFFRILNMWHYLGSPRVSAVKLFIIVMRRLYENIIHSQLIAQREKRLSFICVTVGAAYFFIHICIYLCRKWIIIKNLNNACIINNILSFHHFVSKICIDYAIALKSILLIVLLNMLLHSLLCILACAVSSKFNVIPFENNSKYISTNDMTTISQMNFFSRLIHTFTD